MSHTDLIPVDTVAPGSLASAADRAREFARRARSAQTIRCYRGDWSDFEAWCGRNHLASLPAAPETVAMYISSLAGVCKASTIQRRLSAISQIHQMNRHESPVRNEVVRSVMQGIRRTLGVAPEEKLPLLAADLREMVAAIPGTAAGLRDRALLLLGFCGAFRRSELVGLNVEDLEFTGEGLVLWLRRSKTDQEGRGRRIGVPALPSSDACPVRAVRAWIAHAAIESGPLFRPVTFAGRVASGRLSAYSVAVIVKKRLPPGKDATRFAGHSLRAGFVTSAASGGASPKAIMKQTGHRSLVTLMRYMRDATLFQGNALERTGL